jgi:glycosyltransferase involved in cell wall biosynthesis
MKVAFIAAGAADMYCGSCLRDHALAVHLRALGHEVTLVPTYTPLRVEGEPASEKHVFFGGIEVYLAERLPALRERRGLLGRVLGSQALLRWLGGLSLATDPRKLGRLTVSVLRGEEGNQRRLLAELAAWLRDHVRPDVVHLSSSLFTGFARELKRDLGVPVVCGLQGEDLFLAGLEEPYRAEALALVRDRGADVERFIATSTHAKEHMAARAGLDPEKIDVVLPGIALDDFPAPPAPRAPPPLPRAPERPPVIGYLARIAPEKGLHHLVAAFARLAASGEIPGLRLKIAGYLGAANVRYAASIRRALAARGLGGRVELLGTVDRSQKLDFLRAIDVLSVPTDYPEPKGLFVLEALAAGVPVVEPAHGAFPEILEATGGGLLHAPGDSEDLARKLAALLGDEPLRRRLGEEGRAAVRARFSARRMAEETLSIYERVTGRDAGVGSAKSAGSAGSAGIGVGDGA